MLEKDSNNVKIILTCVFGTVALRFYRGDNSNVSFLLLFVVVFVFVCDAHELFGIFMSPKQKRNISLKILLLVSILGCLKVYNKNSNYV